jgi:hypothetical protein
MLAFVELLRSIDLRWRASFVSASFGSHPTHSR